MGKYGGKKERGREGRGKRGREKGRERRRTSNCSGNL